jgi:excisionase family DNA binding protein
VDGLTEKLYSPEEVSEITGFHRQAIYRAVRRGELRAFRICKRIRIKQEDLQAWIEREPIEVARREFHDAPRTIRVGFSDSLRLVRDSELERGRR